MPAMWAVALTRCVALPCCWAVQVCAGVPAPHAAPYERGSRQDLPPARPGGTGRAHVSCACSVRNSLLARVARTYAYHMCSVHLWPGSAAAGAKAARSGCGLGRLLSVQAGVTQQPSLLLAGCRSRWALARTPPQACPVCPWAGAMSLRCGSSSTMLACVALASWLPCSAGKHTCSALQVTVARSCRRRW